jgi:flagellar protein FliO/FliZ
VSRHILQILAGTLACGLVGSADAAATAGAGTPAPVSAVSAWEVVQVAGGMGLVILAIVASAWVARRMLRMPTGLQGQLRVLSGVSMGTREKVVLLQVGETQLLLGVAPGRIQTLHVLERPLEITDTATTPSTGFSAQLGSLLKQARVARSPRD